MNKDELSNTNETKSDLKKQSRLVRFSITFVCVFIFYSVIMIVSWPTTTTTTTPAGMSPLQTILLGSGFFALFGGIVAMLLPTARKIIYLPVSLIITKIFVVIFAQIARSFL